MQKDYLFDGAHKSSEFIFQPQVILQTQHILKLPLAM